MPAQQEHHGSPPPRSTASTPKSAVSAAAPVSTNTSPLPPTRLLLQPLANGDAPAAASLLITPPPSLEHHNATSTTSCSDDSLRRTAVYDLVVSMLLEAAGDAAAHATASRVEAAIATLSALSTGASESPLVTAARSLVDAFYELATARPRGLAVVAREPSRLQPVATSSPNPFLSVDSDGRNTTSSPISLAVMLPIDMTSLPTDAPTLKRPPLQLGRHRLSKRSSAATVNKSIACLSDSGLSRRQSTAFFNRAELGDEADDGTFTINQHIVLMQLGSGAQGEVFLAMDTDANELRAIKAIRRPAAILANAAPRTALELARDSKRAQLQREIAIMKKCRHRNIVSLYEVIDDPSLDVMYLVMQYVDKGPIATIRNDGTIEKRIEAGALADYALQIVKGLRYLHRSGIIHRDIKPDNILVGSKGDVYLADFGVSELFDDDGDSSVAGTRGTLAFLAPELLVMRDTSSLPRSAEGTHDTGSNSRTAAATTTTRASAEVHGEAVDVWALGVTLYTLLLGRVPWKSMTVTDLIAEITSVTAESSVSFPTQRTEPSTLPPAASIPVLPTFDFLPPLPLTSFNPDPLAATQRTDHATHGVVELVLSHETQDDADDECTVLWTALLRGMLHPDPNMRSPLRQVLTDIEDIQKVYKASHSIAEYNMSSVTTPPLSLSPTALPVADSITTRQQRRSMMVEASFGGGNSKRVTA